MPLPPISIFEPLSEQTPPRIQVAKYARNGLIPHAEFETQLGAALNFTAACRTKNLFTWACPLSSIPTSSYTDRTRWRFAAHTSPLLRRIRAVVYVARHNQGDPISTPPSVTLTISDGGLTIYGSATFSIGNRNPSDPVSDVPSEFTAGHLIIEDVPAGTDIYGFFVDSAGGRLIAATVYEESLPITQANGYLVPHAVSVGGSIFYQRRETSYELATQLWKRGGAQLINWTVNNQSSPLTNSQAIPRNVIDNSGTLDSQSPGWPLDLRYCRTRTRNTVPCVLKAYGYTAGSGGVGMFDSTGNPVAAITSFGASASWQSTTVDLPAAEDTYYFYFFGDNSNTMNLGAISLYQYES